MGDTYASAGETEADRAQRHALLAALNVTKQALHRDECGAWRIGAMTGAAGQSTHGVRQDVGHVRRLPLIPALDLNQETSSTHLFEAAGFIARGSSAGSGRHVICSTKPLDVRQVLSWLPTDTETAIVTKDFSIPDFEGLHEAKRAGKDVVYTKEVAFGVFLASTMGDDEYSLGELLQEQEGFCCRGGISTHS